jgi:hypothetical protein
MNTDVIKSRIDIAWQDASSFWKDEYASRYKAAVIIDLDNTLDRINKASTQMGEAIYTALANLNEFND